MMSLLCSIFIFIITMSSESEDDNADLSLPALGHNVSEPEPQLSQVDLFTLDSSLVDVNNNNNSNNTPHKPPQRNLQHWRSHEEKMEVYYFPTNF